MMRRRVNRPNLWRPRYPNVVATASVELGDSVPDAWFFTPTGTEWAHSEARTGNRSLHVQVANAVADWRSSLYAAVGARRYRVGLWVKGAGAPEMVLAARWFADTEGAAYLNEQWLVLDGHYSDWTRVYRHVIAPVGAQTGDLMFRAAFATTVDLYADDFTVRRLH
jgi:hypothetical protein